MEASRIEESRRAFESWISGAPFERTVRRYPEVPENYAWPGCYTDIDVDLAWRAWQAAVEFFEK